MLVSTVTLTCLGPIYLVGPGSSSDDCTGPSWNWLLQRSLAILARMTLLLYALSGAAAVTEKCSRTKLFVNSLRDETKPILNLDRAYLVRYMDDSNAGFYIKGVKLTSFHLMKMFYAVGLLGGKQQHNNSWSDT